MSASSDFINPRSRFYGDFSPQNLIFNANLQEFSQKVGIITALATGGKLSSEEAYRKIQDLWFKLQDSKQQLGITNVPNEKIQEIENS
jgi:polyhydroxyalkanoate synthesis regulator phasin